MNSIKTITIESMIYHSRIVKIVNLTMMISILSMSYQIGVAQDVEIEGRAKLTVMERDTLSTDIVVRQHDGTLAIRDITAVSCPGGTVAEGPYYLGKDTLDGIVFHLYTGDDGQQHGLIVSKVESGNFRWQNSASLVGADRTWDGEFNSGVMTNSPAKDYVTANFSAEWYIPSTDELSILFQNRYYANKALFDGGYDLITRSFRYWSSTEHSEPFAFLMRMAEGDFLGLTSKTQAQRVRPIKAF